MLLAVGRGGEQEASPVADETRGELPELAEVASDEVPAEGRYYPVPRRVLDANERRAAALESIGYAAGAMRLRTPRASWFTTPRAASPGRGCSSPVTRRRRP
ncbi:MAG: hypothetical protein O2816_03710 [Planctomycetota bacterium]|nr:hypothetical protein [Planctomycetota bacterium]